VEESIRNFTNYLRDERNASPHTLRNYLSDLAQLQAFLLERELCLDAKGMVEVGKIDIHAVRAFLGFVDQGSKEKFDRTQGGGVERFLSFLTVD
jgi:site-specific recombinase XerC